MSKNKIVIIDDDEDLLKILSNALQAKDFETVEFTNGKDGLEYLLDEKKMKESSLLILDRMLPDIEGLEILKKIEEKYPKGHLPVLVLSALSSEKDVLDGLKIGAIDYLTKPFNLSILTQKATALIERECE